MRPIFALLALSVLLTLVSISHALDWIHVDPTSHMLTDSLGRVRIFHGVNVVYKPSPFYPPNLETFDPVRSLCEEDAANLQKWGINFIRLHAGWQGYEPQRGMYNSTYLDVLEKIVNMLSKYNIHVLLDAHQDVLNRKYCGEGVPDWAAIDTGEPKFADPIIEGFHFDEHGYPPLEECLKHEFALFYLSHAVGAAFQNLYSNTNGIADAFANFWRAVASRFSANSAIVGYEVINEPWAGDIYKDSALLWQPGYADRKNLMPFYERVARSIRSVDSDHLFFYEPSLVDLAWIGFDHVPLGSDYNNRSVLSYHIYCGDVDSHGDPKSRIVCDAQDSLVYDSRMREIQSIGGGAFLTEWGANTNSTSGIQQMHELCELADRHFQSWSYWQFKFYDDYTTQNHPPQGESFYDLDGKLEIDKVAAISRTYAQAIAGNPVKMEFDPESARFSLLYSIDKSVSIQPSIVYLNEAIHYPSGFVVDIEPPTAAQYVRVEENYLEIRHIDPSSHHGWTLSVTITRK